MAHHRETVRKAITTAVTGLTTTGANVFASRVRPYEDQTLPCLGVFGLAETVDAETIELEAGGAAQVGLRTYTVAIEGRARLGADPVALHDTLDDIGAEVEAAVVAAQAAGNLGCQSVTITGTDLELDDEAQADTGLVTVTVECQYYLDAAAPGAAA